MNNRKGWVFAPRISVFIAVVVLGVLLSFVIPTGIISQPRTQSTTQLRPAASAIELGVDGWSAGAVGLSWTSGPGFWYNHYYVYYSPTSATGPWYEIGSYTTALTFFATGLSADTAYWFYVNDTYLSSSEASNSVQVTTAFAPNLLQIGETYSTITLEWLDHTSYSSLMGFYQYSVLENGAQTAYKWQYLANISTYSTREYNVTSLTEGYAAEFQVQVWNQCSTGCSPVLYAESSSVPIVARTNSPPPPPVIPPTGSSSSPSSSNTTESSSFVVILVVVVLIGYLYYSRKKKSESQPEAPPPPPPPPQVPPPGDNPPGQ